MIYFTSDLHLGHNKDFLYKSRGFNSIEEHDEQIIDNINSIVTDHDILYILGDCIMGDQEAGIEKLNSICGNKRIIIGNHDTINKIELYRHNYYGVEFGDRIKYGKFTFLLSHYPMRTKNVEETCAKRTFCLCGHSHTKDPFLDFNLGSYHVELDCHNNKPVSIDEIITDIKSRLN